MRTKFRNLPLQYKITSISLFLNMIVFAINLILLVSINNMSGRIDSVYRANLQLNELQLALNDVQENMTEYLNVKTSDALEDYYRSAQNYQNLIEDLDGKITLKPFGRMERSIYNMSEKYIEEAEQTIEAKRGRNVEKYRQRYEEASDLYGYINTYINSLNNEQFKENSENYREMINAFRVFETIGNVILFTVIISNAVLILRLTAAIIQPLKSLTGMASEVSNGNFDIEPLPVYSGDEIGVVTKTFNQMVVSIQDYIVRIRESVKVEQQLKEKELMMEAHLKDAQLKYLQAQINPHFLFNTLNAGAQLAMMEGADKTYEYVKIMAEFFRYNVKKGSQTVTIGEELELVDNYIYILNVRFSGDIKYEKDIDKKLLGVEMPSMILQPIVENCVNHGIRDMMGEGKIKVSVYSIEHTACIRVEDNGIGMSEETIQNLMSGKAAEKDDKKSSTGIGMDNVMARLKLFVGSDDVMSIESEGEGKGSKFTIYLDMKEA